MARGLAQLARIEVDNDFRPGVIFVCRQIIRRAFQHGTARCFRRRPLNACAAAAGYDFGVPSISPAWFKLILMVIFSEPASLMPVGGLQHFSIMPRSASISLSDSFEPPVVFLPPSAALSDRFVLAAGCALFLVQECGNLFLIEFF